MKKLTGLEFLSSFFFQFVHSAEPHISSSLPNSSPSLSWLSGDDKLRSWRWFFSTKQQLNTGRSLPVPYLNLWLRFITAVTAKTVISKLLSLNYFMLFAFNGLSWFHKKTVNHFFIDVKRLLRVCFFNRNGISCVSPKISRLLS